MARGCSEGKSMRGQMSIGCGCYYTIGGTSTEKQIECCVEFNNI